MKSNANAPASGLQTIVDVILAPKSAFERLRTAPTWGWAFIISVVAGTFATYLIVPALVHAFQVSWPAMVASDPRTAALTPAQQQTALQFTLAIMRFSWLGALVGIPVVIFIATLVMLVFNAIGRGSGTFASLWAAAVNISIPSNALGSLVLAVIVLIRGAQSFDSTASVSAALPSLALLAPSGGVKLAAFLAAINVFSVWGAVLIYVAMRTTARVGAASAMFTALLMPLATAVVAAFGAR